MTPIVSDTLTVAGAASLVSVVVQLTKFLIDLAVTNPATNARATRLWVFIVALGVVALPPLQRIGFHWRGDLLSLLTLAGVVATAALGGYHLLSQAPISTPTMPPQIAPSRYAEPTPTEPAPVA